MQPCNLNLQTFAVEWVVVESSFTFTVALSKHIMFPMHPFDPAQFFSQLRSEAVGLATERTGLTHYKQHKPVPNCLQDQHWHNNGF